MLIAGTACGNDFPFDSVASNQPLEVQRPAPAPLAQLAHALHVEEVGKPQKPHNQELAAVSGMDPLPLPKPSAAQKSGTTAIPKFSFGGNRIASISASLFVVIGLFLAFVWVGKKNMKPAVGGPLSKEIFQVLGKSQLSGKQQLELVRVGQKLLLLCVSPGGVDTLTEITDPAEVERLLAIIRQDSPSSMKASFQDILSTMGRQPARGFLEA